MDESVVVLAYRLEAHLRSGSLDGGLLSVLGGTAAGCPPALSDVGALLTHLAALPRQHRQRFQDALTSLRAGDAWHGDLEHTLALLSDRPNESCLWCRARLVELQTAEHLKEMLQAFGYARAAGRKDELANLLVLLLPFCVATQAVSRGAAAAAAAAPPPQQQHAAAAAPPERTGRERPEPERRRERATFRRTTASDGSTVEEAVFEREVAGGGGSSGGAGSSSRASNGGGSAVAGPSSDTAALATFFAEHFYRQYNTAGLRSLDVELFAPGGVLLVGDGDDANGGGGAGGRALSLEDAPRLASAPDRGAGADRVNPDGLAMQAQLVGPAALEMLHTMRVQHGVRLVPDLEDLQYPDALTSSTAGRRMRLRVHGRLQVDTADAQGQGIPPTQAAATGQPVDEQEQEFAQDFSLKVGVDGSVQVERTCLVVCAAVGSAEGHLLLGAEGAGADDRRSTIDGSAKRRKADGGGRGRGRGRRE